MKLQDLQLYKENNQYYLSAKFFYEDRKGYYEMFIPKIKLPVSQDCEVNMTNGYDCFNKAYKTVDVFLGFGPLSAKPFNDKGELLTLTCLEEKVHKMTLAEIEEALGYKIELKEESHLC